MYDDDEDYYGYSGVRLPRTPFQRRLRKAGACWEARKWVGNKTFEQAWRTCRYGPWMEWFVDNMLPDTPVNDKLSGAIHTAKHRSGFYHPDYLPVRLANAIRKLITIRRGRLVLRAKKAQPRHAAARRPARPRKAALRRN